MDPLQIAFRQALRFALDYHTGQTRKGSAVPYTVHPVTVAETLAYHYPDRLELVLAGLLHDVVEDTDATLEQVERRFGPTVAELVDAVTKPAVVADLPDDPVERWNRKREAQLDKLRRADPDAYRLEAADALANLRSLERDLRHASDRSSVWRHFDGSESQTLAWYGRVLELVSAHLTADTDAGLLGELREAAHAVGARTT